MDHWCEMCGGTEAEHGVENKVNRCKRRRMSSLFPLSFVTESQSRFYFTRRNEKKNHKKISSLANAYIQHKLQNILTYCYSIAHDDDHWLVFSIPSFRDLDVFTKISIT